MHNPLPTPPASPEEDDAYYREVPQNLIARGAELAVQIHESATKPETHPESAQKSAPESTSEVPQTAEKRRVDATLAYDRILRAIRRTIALARDIAEFPIGTRPRRAAPTPATEKPKKHSPDRIRITQRIQKAIERYGDRGEDVLRRNLLAYIPDKDLHGSIDGIPFGEILPLICKDLNIDIEAMWARHIETNTITPPRTKPPP